MLNEKAQDYIRDWIFETGGERQLLKDAKVECSKDVFIDLFEYFGFEEGDEIWVKDGHTGIGDIKIYT